MKQIKGQNGYIIVKKQKEEEKAGGFVIPVDDSQEQVFNMVEHESDSKQIFVVKKQDAIKLQRFNDEELYAIKESDIIAKIS